jgi:hypothetical protein
MRSECPSDCFLIFTVSVVEFLSDEAWKNAVCLDTATDCPILAGPRIPANVG